MVTNSVAKNTIGYKRRVDNLYPASEVNSPMMTTASQTSAELAIALLTHYSFDLSGHTASELIKRWQTQYPVTWLHLAVVEALYQGRYKGISVQQILAFWQRRGQAIYHFNMEFERLICSKFPECLTELAAPVLPTIKPQIPSESAAIPQPVAVNPLPAMVGNRYRQPETATIPEMNLQQQEKPEENILVSSTLRTSASATQAMPNSQNNFPRKSTLPKPHQEKKLLPPSANHPPIGQFTPGNSNHSDSFTSKLKAMSDDQR